MLLVAQPYPHRSPSLAREMLLAQLAAAMLRPLLIHRALSDGYRRLKAAVACCSDAALVRYFILCRPLLTSCDFPGA